MGQLAPIAFDIETSGLDTDAVVTVAGLATELGAALILNTRERPADSSALQRELESHANRIRLEICRSEQALLAELHEIAHSVLDGDSHYLTAYHGETWNGGFDLPFLRSACVTHDVMWPFPDVAYADTMDMIDRFDTDDANDLVGVYETLIGGDSCDPFTESAAAVDAFETATWDTLLLHNLADIQRTRELALLAHRYVPKSDFNMKSLHPPDRS